jgi:MFS-type transporter involved in bile tolerance (Atg22 family)
LDTSRRISRKGLLTRNSSTTRLRLWLTVAAGTLVAGAIGMFFLTSHSPLAAVIGVTALFGLVAGFGNVTNQTVLYIQAPAEKVGTASGLLRTFGYIGSIAAATITGISFHAQVGDPGLHRVAVILIGVGLAVLLLTIRRPATRGRGQAQAPQQA